MRLIDTHCHLDFPQFDSDRSDVLQYAHDSGVTDVVVPGVSARHWQRLTNIVMANDRLHAVYGLHPCFMGDHTQDDLNRLQGLLQAGGACAVGEIGLDLFIPDTDLERQLYFLKAQLEFAKSFDLPVILHVRKAHDQMLKLLRRFSLPKAGVIHAFSGSEQQAKQYIGLGFKLGIGGTVTYERARRLRRIVESTALQDMVLETDAPDMPLAAYRGEINQPCRIAEVAKVIAFLKGCSTEEVALETTAQACNLFGIK